MTNKQLIHKNNGHVFQQTTHNYNYNKNEHLISPNKHTNHTPIILTIPNPYNNNTYNQYQNIYKS